MKEPPHAQAEPDEPVPRSESEQRLSAKFRSNDRMGALAEERANADTAFAMGHTRGFEEAREAHFDSLRTLLMRILEATGKVDDDTLETIERASLDDLQDWILRAALPEAE